MKNTSNLLIFSIFTLCLLSFASCKKNVEGCTDPKFKNYNAMATKDDGSCDSSSWNGGGNGNNNPVLGCMNPDAVNYNPNATQDDGSCIILGCTDPTAINYNPNANRNDGTCIYPDKREKFVGDWEVANSTCAFPFNLNSPVVISYDSLIQDTLVFEPFLFNLPAKATVSGFNLTFPQQSAGGFINFSGSGSMLSDSTKISCTFTYTTPFGANTCTADYLRQ